MKKKAMGSRGKKSKRTEQKATMTIPLLNKCWKVKMEKGKKAAEPGVRKKERAVQKIHI